MTRKAYELLILISFIISKNLYYVRYLHSLLCNSEKIA